MLVLRRIAIVTALAFLFGMAVAARLYAADGICDPNADYFLGTEDYGRAIAAHRQVIALHPDDALAHYHLGFAYGITGNREQELAEYRASAALGLRQWDLYLNLGRALLESGDLTRATTALATATALGPEHPEGHFNLGLAYERRGMLAAARDEMASSLKLDPNQPDARNMLGLIYAEANDYSHARQVWTELALTQPDFEPARRNLAILDQIANPGKNRQGPSLKALRTASAVDPR
jgi:protein O-mannosyl-transferase